MKRGIVVLGLVVMLLASGAWVYSTQGGNCCGKCGQPGTQCPMEK